MLSTHSSPHVLAYDDDPGILGIYEELLGEEGYRVTLATDLDADPTDIADARPDVIIVDLVVGGTDRGSGLLARLRAHPATRDIPVLVVSGDTARLKSLDGRLRDWACTVVEKPFDIYVLLAAVQSSLR